MNMKHDEALKEYNSTRFKYQKNINILGFWQKIKKKRIIHVRVLLVLALVLATFASSLICGDLRRRLRLRGASTATATKQAESRRNAINKIHELLCDGTTKEQEKDFTLKDWADLCSGNFVMTAAQKLLDGDEVNIVQIGAHVGFEENDPLATGLSRLLEEVAAVDYSAKSRNEIRQHFHWTFVEPSPPNFKRLSENLLNNSAICDMKGVNAAVVSDSLTYSSDMPFYSIRDTIDPETGFDSLSGKTFPFWITQVSSFSKSPLIHNRAVFSKLGLRLEDYMVEMNVTTKSFSKLMQDTLVGGKNERPLLVLIDTEGFDCDIIKGISLSSPYLPQYLLFEHKQCRDKKGAWEHLKKLGYELYPPGNENILAVKTIATNRTSTSTVP
jgi:hypothetical protein